MHKKSSKILTRRPEPVTSALLLTWAPVHSAKRHLDQKHQLAGHVFDRIFTCLTTPNNPLFS